MFSNKQLNKNMKYPNEIWIQLLLSLICRPKTFKSVEVVFCGNCFNKSTGYSETKFNIN